MSQTGSERILIVDDNTEIHADIRETLNVKPVNELSEFTKAKLFGTPDPIKSTAIKIPSYQIDSAYQGVDAVEMIKNAINENHPYSLAFVDMRMPPGWDGVQTIQAIWQVDPTIEIVICSAYSDYSWEEISESLKCSDNLLILKKPYDNIEVRQLAASLTTKNRLKKQITAQLENLQTLSNQLGLSLSQTEATLEATQEGILVLNHAGFVTQYNKVLLTQWDALDADLNKPNFQLLDWIMSQTTDQGSLEKIFSDLKNQILLPHHHVITTKSGKILELRTSHQKVNNTIMGVVCSFHDVTEARKLQHKMIHHATHDHLTGLPNRSGLIRQLEQVIFQAQANNTQLFVLLINLNNFKDINNTLGHEAGDLLLRSIAKTIAGNTHEHNILARLGCDEFVVVVPGHAEKINIANTCERLLDAIKEPLLINDHELNLSANIGVSIFPKDGSCPESLLNNAYIALYAVKATSGNQYQCFETELNTLIWQRLELASDLRKAIDANQLIVQYQPLYDLQTNKVLSMEASLHWKHPVRGNITPNEIISILEDTGLILQVGNWLLREACQQNKVWHQMGHADLKVNVHITKKQFYHNKFVETIMKTLVDVGLPPKFLELELSEELILSKLAENTQTIRRLKAIGVNFTIDDFGREYAILSHLKKSSIDKVKIDKQFIEGIGVSDNANHIVEVIIAITKQFGITVLAKGVEDNSQIEFLRSNHGDNVEGYYFSAPLNPSESTAILNKQNAL